VAYGQMLLHSLLGLPSGAEAPLFRKLYVRAEALTPESEEVCLRQRRGGHENRYASDFFGAEVVRFVGDRFLKSIR
jgi:hypothetical protein